MGAHERQKTFFEPTHIRNVHVVEEPVGARENHRHDLGVGQRRILRLLHHLGQTRTPGQKRLGGGIKVRAKLRKRRHLAVLRQRQLHRTRNRRHRLRLRARPNPRHRQTGVHSRANTLEEQFRLKKDLTVGDRNHVGRNKRRNVAALRFNDRKRRQRPATIVLVQLRGPLQKTRVQVENVTRISFTAGRTTQQKRHLTIRHGLLRQVIIHDQGVTPVVTEELGHRGRRIGRKELHRRRVGRGRGHNDRILNRAGLFELLHQLRHGRALLPHRHIDAVELLVLVIPRRVVIRFLVQDRIKRHSRLTGLTVANDQLALATANGDHRVDGLQARRHRLADRFARDDARRLAVCHPAFRRVDRTLTVERIAKAVHNATQKAVARRHVHDRVRALDGVAFFNVAVGAEDHDADVVAFQVQRHALNATGEFDHLTGLHIVEAVDPRDPVTDGQHAANFGNLRVLTERLDLVLEDLRNLSCLDRHFIRPLSSCSGVR